MRMLQAVVIVGLAGCASVGHKIDVSKIDQIKQGETTKQEVIGLLGSPDQITKDMFGNTTFTYMFMRATAKPASFIPVVGAFAGGANVQNQMFMATFSPEDIVISSWGTYGANESGIGAAAAGKANLSGVTENKRPE